MSGIASNFVVVDVVAVVADAAVVAVADDVDVAAVLAAADVGICYPILDRNYLLCGYAQICIALRAQLGEPGAHLTQIITKPICRNKT